MFYIGLCDKSGTTTEQTQQSSSSETVRRSEQDVNGMSVELGKDDFIFELTVNRKHTGVMENPISENVVLEGRRTRLICDRNIDL